MPETLHPGVYKQEIVGNPPVEGVSISTAAFVGCASKGAIGEAVLVTSWNQFVRNYGSFYANGYLAYAVRSFFENGGTRAYISRVVHAPLGVKSSAISTAGLVSGDATPATLANVFAINDGVWGDSISVVTSNFDYASLSFDLVVKYASVEVERFEEIDLANIESYINGVSKYITVTLLSATPTIVWVAEQTVTLTGGDDGLTGIADSDYIGENAVLKAGLYAFDNVDVSIVAIPGIATVAVHQGIVTYVEGRGDCFGILDAPSGKTPAEMITYKNTEAALASEYCAMYYPWVYASDSIGVGKAPKKLLPPSGFIAGIYARTDNSRGISKAPAGTASVLLGALSLEYSVTNGEQDTLNPQMINVIRLMSGSGICVWGARTLKKGDYTYVPVRRTNIYIAESLMNALQFAVFEPNNAVLWDKIVMKGEAFLEGMRANKEIVDYFVVCDDTINTEDVVDAGKLYVDVGVANQKPAEFVVFRLSLI